MSRMRSLFSLGLCALLALGGCAYGFKAGKVRPGLETVAVPYFENRSDEPDIEVALTEAILAGIIQDRTLRVASEDEADALVVGTVRLYEFNEAFFGSDRQAEEYRLDVVVEVSLVDRRTDEIIVGPERIKGTGSYYLSEGPSGEEQAREDAARQIVEGILNLVLEEW